MKTIRRIDLTSVFLFAAAFLILVFGNGCATPAFVTADQARKDAVQAPITAFVAAHPEQSQTWSDFTVAWQKDIDANKGGFSPWWSTK